MNTKRKPSYDIWMRYIDGIFFIWQHDKNSLENFVKFCDNYSFVAKMMSKIRFDKNYSTESVNFLDVKVKFKDGNLSTSLYSKPTDAHLYLNAKSCHPRHVIKNLPKGQFIRIRRICSDDADFDRNAIQTKRYFVQRGFAENQEDVKG